MRKPSTLNRRNFLASTVILPFLNYKKNTPKLCYNTMACPSWNFKQIIDKAKVYGFGAVELRCYLDQRDLFNHPDFSATNIPSLKRIANDNGVKVLMLNSSTQLHHREPKKRKQHLDDAKRYIDLAEKLETPFIRVFPDKLLGDDPLGPILSGLQTLNDYAKESGVEVLLDAHGDLVDSNQLLSVLQTTGNRLIWDQFNMYKKTGEATNSMVKTLQSKIAVAQYKDGLIDTDGSFHYTLPGKGQFPIEPVLNALKSINFKGYLSFEWEKHWHPELANPDIALPAFVRYINS
ncbi:sugar phosphate isomerase/epimerase family protein [Jiulongibacter sp. NS-SX5]|uniref:sugar phosphate isomerase/epimerase family protein n=1 Tax=Jiulongibacter sp. NS-SX5 TaxID=3463854 RepID=UPI00405A4B49